MILVFVVLFICLIAILSLNRCLLIVSLILLLLAFLFTLAVGIFIFIGTRVRYWNESQGCDTDYEGLYKAWSSVDVYIQAVDEIFCSKRCPCYFNRTTEYKFLQNNTFAPYLSQWTYVNNSDAPVRFQDCDEQEVKDAYNKYLMRNSYYNHTIKAKKFNKYMKKIEKHFHCTGFCSTTYFNQDTKTTGRVAKYLFSDVTKGVPDYIGCLIPMRDWLYKTLIAFAVLCLLLFLLLFILFIIVIFLLLGATEDEKEKEEADEIHEPKPVQEQKPVEEEPQRPVTPPKPIPKKKKLAPPQTPVRRPPQPEPEPEPEEEEKEEEKEEPEPVKQQEEQKSVQPSVSEQSEMPSESLDNTFRPNASQIGEKSIEFLPSNFNP
ncbi:MAG: hypothetical protein MJ252_09450 [archaeon]|nr:hypothetical protein [archaeon]